MISNELIKFLGEVSQEYHLIADDRKRELQKLTAFIQGKLNDDSINLIFICSHNSRRSHLAQVWAQVAAHHYGFQNIHCFSGGTEVTELYPAIVEAMVSQGFQIDKLSEGNNPEYAIKYAENSAAVIGFSKLYDDNYNPQSDFGAVMVCSSADKNCAFIPTAVERMLLSYEDPKEFDDTPQQLEKYQERSKQIARELMYAFSNVQK